MKPTSMIFLVLSMILFFGGFLTCKFAVSMAESDQIAIYAQDFDENGDAVYTYAITDEEVDRLSLNFSGVDVTVIGGSETSYLELKNFDVHSYTVSLSSRTVTVNGSSGFLSSLIDTSSGGISFKGLRYFFQNKPDPSRPKSVTVYLASGSSLSGLHMSLEDGNLTLKNIDLPIEDCSINLTNANANLSRVNTEKLMQITAQGGDVNIENSSFALVDAKVTDGNVSVDSVESLAFQNTNYELKIEKDGSIRYNGGYAGTEYPITSALPKYAYRVVVTNGTISIMDGGLAADVPLPETEPEETTATP